MLAIKNGFTTSMGDVYLFWCIFLVFLAPLFIVAVLNDKSMNVIHILMHSILWLVLSFYITGYMYKKLLRITDEGKQIDLYDIKALKILGIVFLVVIILPLYVMSVFDPQRFNIVNYLLIIIFPSLFIGQEVVIGKRYILYKSFIIEIKSISSYNVIKKRHTNIVKLVMSGGKEFHIRMKPDKSWELMKIIKGILP